MMILSNLSVVAICYHVFVAKSLLYHTLSFSMQPSHGKKDPTTSSCLIKSSWWHVHLKAHTATYLTENPWNKGKIYGNSPKCWDKRMALQFLSSHRFNMFNPANKNHNIIKYPSISHMNNLWGLRVNIYIVNAKQLESYFSMLSRNIFSCRCRFLSASKCFTFIASRKTSWAPSQRDGDAWMLGGDEQGSKCSLGCELPFRNT